MEMRTFTKDGGLLYVGIQGRSVQVINISGVKYSENDYEQTLKVLWNLSVFCRKPGDGVPFCDERETHEDDYNKALSKLKKKYPATMGL